MILTSVIIVLREVLEAALLISLLLAMSVHILLKLRWIISALCFGLGFAVIYANQLAVMSNWLGGIGQEMVNALLQISIAMLLGTGCLYIVKRLATPSLMQPTTIGKINFSLQDLSRRRLFKSLLITVVALAIIREGSEIIIYVFGFASNKEIFTTVLLGGFIGLGIGISIGIIFFYSLINVKFDIFIVLLATFSGFIAAGLLVQSISLFYQADLLEMDNFLWDSSPIISEESIVGQLLYAVIGYEATPSLLQVIVYSTTIAGFLFLAAYFYVKKDRPKSL